MSRRGVRWKERSYIRNHEPLVKELLLLLDADPRTQREVSDASGVSSQTLHAWRTSHTPHVHLMVAVLNALGYTLKIVKNEKRDSRDLPPTTEASQIHTEDGKGDQTPSVGEGRTSPSIIHE